MDSYSVTFARSARKELLALDESMARRILTKIEDLAQEPRPRGSRKLRGSSNRWRIRVGSYRVVYRIDDSKNVVDIVIVRHRRDVYK